MDVSGRKRQLGRMRKRAIKNASGREWRTQTGSRDVASIFAAAAVFSALATEAATTPLAASGDHCGEARAGLR
jgi:hypothetical protein